MPDINTEIEAQLPTNGSRQISALNLRTVLEDMVKAGPTVVTAKSFGAAGDGVTDDTAAINAAFRYIESVGQPIPFVFGPFVFKIAGSLVLPTTPGNQFQYIMGDGCKIVKTGAGVALGRVPSVQAEADTMIDQCIYNITGIFFLGDGTTGQIGLHIGANYTSVVESCSFQDLDIGSIGTFILGGLWRNLRYTNCMSKPFILQSGHGDGTSVWTGGGLNNAASNCNLIENCRVFGRTTQTASFTIYGSDAVTLHNCISEGGATLYDIFFDYQNATTVKVFTIDGLHCENPNGKVNLKIKATGVVNIKDVVRSYPAAILDPQGSVAAHFIFTGLSYIDNMPASSPWFYHTDGGGYGGTPGGTSSGSVFSFKDMGIGNIFATDLVLPAHWENNTGPVYELEAERGANGGRFMGTNAFYMTCFSAYIRNREDTAFAPIQGKITTDTNYTAGAPTATGYLTLYDATGTAYKVLVST